MEYGDVQQSVSTSTLRTEPVKSLQFEKTVNYAVSIADALTWSMLCFVRPPNSPETIHLLHIVQGDHAVSQDDVQQTIGAEEELATEVLSVQLRHFHQHSHGSSVHLVRVFPADYKSTVSIFLQVLINLKSRKYSESDTFKAFVEGGYMKYAA